MTAITIQDIEAAAKKAGGRWDGSRWVFEDADLHPFARALLAVERERCASLASNLRRRLTGTTAKQSAAELVMQIEQPNAELTGRPLGA